MVLHVLCKWPLTCWNIRIKRCWACSSIVVLHQSLHEPAPKWSEVCTKVHFGAEQKPVVVCTAHGASRAQASELSAKGIIAGQLVVELDAARIVYALCMCTVFMANRTDDIESAWQWAMTCMHHRRDNGAISQAQPDIRHFCSFNLACMSCDRIHTALCTTKSARLCEIYDELSDGSQGPRIRSTAGHRTSGLSGRTGSQESVMLLR